MEICFTFSFTSIEKGDKSDKNSKGENKGDKEATFITFTSLHIALDNQRFNPLKKGDKKGDKTPFPLYDLNLNQSKRK